jgi:hypothetical protein
MLSTFCNGFGLFIGYIDEIRLFCFGTYGFNDDDFIFNERFLLLKFISLFEIVFLDLNLFRLFLLLLLLSLFYLFLNIYGL